jgi:hypothetical protein
VDDSNTNNSNIGVILALLFVICFFVFLYFAIPRFFQYIQIVDTNVLPAKEEQLPPYKVPTHTTVLPAVPLSKAKTDNVFAKIEKNLLYDTCMNFAAIDYNRAWIGECSNRGQLMEQCVKKFVELEQGKKTLVYASLVSFITSCACPLPEKNVVRIKEMHASASKKCSQYLEKSSQ